MPEPKTEFIHTEAADYAGLSDGMLDYLCDTGIFRPSISGAPGRGRKRLYSFGDIVVLRAIAGLLRRGLAIRRLKQALNELAERHDTDPITETSTIPRFLVTNGFRAYYRTEHEVLEDLSTKGQYAFAFVIDIHAMRSEVAQELRDSKPSRKRRIRTGAS